MSDELVSTAVETPPITPTPPPVEEPITASRIDEKPDVAALQADIERLEKIRQEKEEQAIKWRKEAREARAEFFKHRGDEPKPPPAPFEDLGIGEEPQKANFDDWDKYNEAKIQYEVKKARAIWDRDEQRKQSESSYQTKVNTVKERINEGYAKHEDFEDVALNPTNPITPTIIEILAECQQPDEVVYYLGKNRLEAIKIARMNPIAAAREVARIEMEITKAAGDNPPGVKKIISGAPPPIQPVGSGPSTAKPLEKMSQREFEAEMEKRTGRRF